MKLEGKRAYVTGASRGIGRAIAVALAKEGADVALVYRSNADEARAVEREIGALGRRAIALKADVSQVAVLRESIAHAHATLGPLDILINNAGIEKRAPFWEVTEADYDSVLDTNLKAAFFASQEFARRLIEARRPGKIINISSVHEDLPFPGYASYCASKGGLRMLTRTLGVELGRFGINVNAIAPGAIRTDINKDVTGDRDALCALLSQIPLGRVGDAREVASLAVFLASQAADYVTGSTYFIDGGLTWNYQEG